MRFMKDPKRFLRFYEGFRFQKFAAYVGNFFHTIQRKKPNQEAPHTQTPYSGHIYENSTPRFSNDPGQQTYEQIGQREFEGHMSQTPTLSRPSTHSLWTRIRMSEAQEGREAPDISPIDMAIDMAKSGDLDDTADTEPEDDEMGSLEDIFQPTDALLDNEFYDHSLDDLAEDYEPADDDRAEDDAQDQMEDQEPEDPDDEPPDDPAMGPGGFPFAPGG